MARTVVAIYEDFSAANEAVRDLVDSGYSRDNISIIANNDRGQYGYESGGATDPLPEPAQKTADNVPEETGSGAGMGAGIGAAIGGIGGLLIGLGALTIPGIGPVIAAGPLAVALSTLTGAGVGAVAGGVTGGLLGALIGLGIPEEEAEFYAESVRRGGVLVTVQIEDAETEKTINVLNRHKPIDIKERGMQWREKGWSGHEAIATQSTPMPQAERMTSVPVPITGMVNDPVMDVSTHPAPDMDRQVGTVDATDFDPENTTLHTHYNTYLANTGYPYDYYLPAYQYGYGMAGDARYQNSTWNVVEPDVQRDWELAHPGTWDRFKTAIRHSWENAGGHNENRPLNSL